jgi:hypothetical protein
LLKVSFFLKNSLFSNLIFSSNWLAHLESCSSKKNVNLLIRHVRWVIGTVRCLLLVLQVNKGFIAQCRVYPKTFIEPEERILERPGGQLVHCVAAHKADIDMMDITKDGNLVVTGELIQPVSELIQPVCEFIQLVSKIIQPISE